MYLVVIYVAGGSIPCRGKLTVFPKNHTESVDHPTSYSMDTEAICPGVKRLEHEAYHSLLSRAEFKNT
jgi:hypothetical protein